MGPPIMYLTLTKWLWDYHVKKLEKNIVEMGMHKLIEQMGNVDLENLTKTITLKKWLVVTLSWKCYKHPPTTPPNMGVNLTLFKRHEPLFHTNHKLLHQIDED
jgi:hypothetical protein